MFGSGSDSFSNSLKTRANKYVHIQCVTDPSGPMAPAFLAAFCGSTVAAITIMGGVFAVLPAYEVSQRGVINITCMVTFLTIFLPQGQKIKYEDTGEKQGDSLSLSLRISLCFSFCLSFCFPLFLPVCLSFFFSFSLSRGLSDNVLVQADLYGPKYVGAIHGRFLLAATVSTIVGPGLLLNLRKMAESDAIKGTYQKLVVSGSAFF